MTREEIKNTPEIVDFMLDKSVIADSRMKLHKRLKEICELATKILEQQPCDDAISRQDAKKYLSSAPNENGDRVIYASDLDLLPSVSPQPKWTLCSEKLPEFQKDVLLSLRSLEVGVGFRAKTEPYFYCEGLDYIEPQNVLAWMPLPEPYKEGEG